MVLLASLTSSILLAYYTAFLPFFLLGAFFLYLGGFFPPFVLGFGIFCLSDSSISHYIKISSCNWSKSSSHMDYIVL
jgi:hypothetical protein